MAGDGTRRPLLLYSVLRDSDLLAWALGVLMPGEGGGPEEPFLVGLRTRCHLPGSARSLPTAVKHQHTSHSWRHRFHLLTAVILPSRNLPELRSDPLHKLEHALGAFWYIKAIMVITYFLTIWLWYYVNSSIMSNVTYCSLENFLTGYNGVFICFIHSWMKWWLICLAWFLFTLWNNRSFLWSSAASCTWSFWMTTIHSCVLLL